MLAGDRLDLNNGPTIAFSARLTGQVLQLRTKVPIAHRDPTHVAARAEMEEGVGGEGGVSRGHRQLSDRQRRPAAHIPLGLPRLLGAARRRDRNRGTMCVHLIDLPPYRLQALISGWVNIRPAAGLPDDFRFSV
jgi:hypothetical protein